MKSHVFQSVVMIKVLRVETQNQCDSWQTGVKHLNGAGLLVGHMWEPADGFSQEQDKLAPLHSTEQQAQPATLRYCSLACPHESG